LGFHFAVKSGSAAIAAGEITMQHLSSGELKKLLEVAAKRSKRDVAMIVLSFRHGLRSAEVCGLTLADVDEDNKRLIVSAKKTRRKNGVQYFEAFMPKDDIAPADLTVIHAWLKERAEYKYAADSNALFISGKGGAMLPRTWSRIFHGIATEAGLRSEARHSHVLRHTAAMASVAGGAQLHTITKMLRHRSIASLTPYVAVSQEEADRQKAKAFQKF
jgi:integrase/recombinase XerD